MRIIFNKLKKGSILAYTLIVLTIMLMTALSVASVTVLEKKSASTTAGSTQAFAVANSGAEKILGYHFRDDSKNLESLGVCNDDGTVTLSNVAGGTARITFYSGAEETATLDCNDTANKLSDVRKVKSMGTYAGTARAVEVAVATEGGSCEWFDESSVISVCGEAGNLYCGTSSTMTYKVDSSANKLCDVKKPGSWAAMYALEGATSGKRVAAWQINSGDWAWSGDLGTVAYIMGVYCCK